MEISTTTVNGILNIVSAKELAEKDCGELRWIIDELLPQGLALCVAPSKSGKSWAALQLALAVASGGKFLGRQCTRGSVLYAALEDSERRLKARMGALNGEEDPPGRLYFVTQVPRLGEGLLQALDGWCKLHTDAALLIIDVLQIIRRPVGARSGGYGNDYAELRELKEFADGHEVALLLIHHTRKQIDESDFLNDVSGTTGLAGVCDTIWSLQKDSRTAEDAVLSITGRDVEMQAVGVRRDGARWIETELRGPTQDPDVRMLREGLDIWPELSGTLPEILGQCGKSFATDRDRHKKATSLGHRMAGLTNALAASGIGFERHKTTRGMEYRVFRIGGSNHDSGQS